MLSNEIALKFIVETALEFMACVPKRLTVLSDNPFVV
jgi:hypothetical protein